MSVGFYLIFRAPISVALIHAFEVVRFA